MRNTRVTALVIAIALLCGCSGREVRVQSDPRARLTGYRTWHWMSDPTSMPKGAFASDATRALDARIRAAISRSLEKVGLYESADARAPSLVVVYHAVTPDRISLTNWGVSYGYGTDPRFPKTEYDYSDEVKPGSLVIDLVDAKNHDLLWRGIEPDALKDLSVSPDDPLLGSVTAILSRLNPRA